MSNRPDILGRLRTGPGENEEETNPVADDGKKIPKGVKLKREVGLFSAVFLIVGTMISSGIFIAPMGVLVLSGSVWMSLIIWTGSGLLSYLGALCYAELGTAIPVSGAEYSYYLHAYGKKGAMGSIPAFLYLWMCSIILKTSMVAIMLLIFAEYLVEPMSPSCPTPAVSEIIETRKKFSKKLVALLAICFITFVNCYSVKMATRMNNFFTFAKLSAVAIIVLVGIYRLYLGHYTHLIRGFEGTRSYSHLATAFYIGLWAYDGCNTLNFVTEELINPAVNLPQAITIGIPIVIVCYLLTNISYLTVLSPSELIASEAVAVSFANNILGPVAFIIPILVAASAFGAANGTCLSASRLLFVAAREGHFPRFMSCVQVSRLTPTPALVFNGIIVFVMIAVGDLVFLMDFFSIVPWMFYGGTMLTVIVLRFTEKNLPRPYKVEIRIPVVMAIVSACVALLPVIVYPKSQYIYAFLFLLSGLLIYIPFVHFRVRLKLMEKLTHLVQLMFNCAPTENN